jgi:hypothetical protein
MTETHLVGLRGQVHTIYLIVLVDRSGSMILMKIQQENGTESLAIMSVSNITQYINSVLELTLLR